MSLYRQLVAFTLALFLVYPAQAQQPLTARSVVAAQDKLKQSYEVKNFAIGGAYDLANPKAWENGGPGGKTLESLGGAPAKTSYIAVGTPKRDGKGEITNAIVVNAYYSGDWKPEYEVHTRLLAGWTRSPDWPKVAWNSALTTDMIFTQPLVPKMSRIRVPTLLVIGTRDRTALGKPFAPPEVQKTMGDYAKLGKITQERIPGSRLVEIPGVGHAPQVEAFPSFEKALLGFLRPPP